MSLIVCPECGNEVSSEAISCPHCGFPISSLGAQKEKRSHTSRRKNNSVLNEQTLSKYKSRATTDKLVYGLIMSLCSITIFVSGIFSFNFVLMIIDFTLSGLALFALIYNLFIIGVRTIKCDDYTILVYLGFKKELIIEGTVHDSVYIGNHLYGVLPNKKRVHIKLTFLTGSPILDVQ